MVDLAEAYRRLDELLTSYGLGGVTYSVAIEVVNHQMQDGEPTIYYTVSAHVPGAGQHGCAMGWHKPTLDDAFKALEVELAPLRRDRPSSSLDDIREVTLPGEVVDAEMPPEVTLPLLTEDEPF